MKNAKKLIALVGAIVMCLTMAVPAFAADTKYAAVNGEVLPNAVTAQVKGGGRDLIFSKSLVMRTTAKVPDVTFEYSIAPGTAKAYTAGEAFEVISPSADTGVTGTPTIGTAVFGPADSKDTSVMVTATTTGKVSPNAAGTGETSQEYTYVTLEDGEKAAIKSVQINFSGVSFSEPGVYRYVIRETSENQQGITYDTQRTSGAQGVDKQRILDVYVVDNGSGTLQVANYVFHETDSVLEASADYGTSGNPSPVGDKSLGFVNEYETHDIAFTKTVTGNQASRDKYFKYDVVITNAGANCNLDLDWSGAEGALAPTHNAATVYDAAAMTTANNVDDNNALDGQQLVCDANGAVTKTFYLQHGQTLRINGLAKGANVTITETPEDYKCNPESNAYVLQNLQADDLDNVFTNTRNGTVPTGIILTVVPGVAIGGAAIAGIAAMVAKKNKKEEDED